MEFRWLVLRLSLYRSYAHSTSAGRFALRLRVCLEFQLWVLCLVPRGVPQQNCSTLYCRVFSHATLPHLHGVDACLGCHAGHGAGHQPLSDAQLLLVCAQQFLGLETKHCTHSGPWEQNTALGASWKEAELKHASSPHPPPLGKPQTGLENEGSGVVPLTRR